ncbi:MAG: beta-propeller domain-containing protein [Nanoarchaeota archaeon]|nr:beta-propeller domain-containing protein [Nanoarchaeota archaeon]
MKKIMIIIALLILAGAFYYSGRNTIESFYPEKELALKTFTSYEDLVTFLKESRAEGGWGYRTFGGAEMLTAEAAPSMAKADTGAAAEEYSTTNIQVEGVDEADIIKNDGKYIYTVSGDKVVIVDAYPAENAKILSEIKFEGTPNEIFINKDRLIVFGQKQNKVTEIEETQPQEGVAAEKMMIAPWPYPRYEQLVFANVYDVSDKEKPELVDEISLRGDYFSSRMIGDYVYLISNEYVYYYENTPIPLPAVTRNDIKKEVPATEIFRCPYPDYSYRYTNILAINTQDKNDELTHKTVLTGSTQNLYMSLNNLYLTSVKRRPWFDYRRIMIEEAVLPLMSGSAAEKIKKILSSDLDDYKKWNDLEETVNDYSESMTSEEKSSFNEKMEEKAQSVELEWQKEMEKTIVHRISIDKNVIAYEAEGEVPGNVLNQFSMDEYDNHFRIATTAGYASTREGEPTSSNNVYVLNMDMDTVGKVEDLAPGEKIYSARFMGKRLYLVTFRNIDPLFVIDLAEPTNPKVLGKLKIPGYSDYLHPYDEDHVIGLGKWTMDAKEQDFAYYQGLKISLFDASDVENPKEIAKYEIGDRGTDSYALHDHKAFLFDKERNLLVIPVLLAEINEEQYPQGIEDWQYGDYKFQGAYVFNVDLEKGIELKGRITHIEDDETFLKSGYYYYNDAYSVKRSLYMDDVLYTVSGKLIKMNSLDDLNEVNNVKLPYEVEQPYYKDMMGGI